MTPSTNKYSAILARLSDGNIHNISTHDDPLDSNATKLLIASSHLSGTYDDMVNCTGFYNLQITPKGLDTLLAWKQQKRDASLIGRLSGPLAFLLGMIISPLWMDLYTWRIKPLVTGVVPETPHTESHDATNQAVGK